MRLWMGLGTFAVRELPLEVEQRPVAIVLQPRRWLRSFLAPGKRRSRPYGIRRESCRSSGRERD